MKKIFFIVSLIAIANSAMAQSGYYHQVGDTVRGKCPIYHYDWWPTLNASGHTDSVIGTTLTLGYMRHTTNTPLKVIGVASTVARMNINDGINMYEEMDNSIDGPFYYVLFDATPAGLVEKARVCWTDDYMSHPKRYMELPKMVGSNSCSGMQHIIDIVSLREYYFDSAITLTDSFYLGCESPFTVGGVNVVDYLVSHTWDYCVYYNEFGVNPNQIKECYTMMPEFIFYDMSRLDNQWHYFRRKRFQLIFPIIEVDTVCVTPGDPYIASRDSLIVRVEWADTSSVGWEVSRTAPGGDPNAGSITPTTSPYVEYTDIDSHSVYHVYVRGRCETGIWSGWSAPCLIDSLPSSPAGVTLLESADFSLSPNPTDGSVQLIGLHSEPTSVEVLDMTGRLLKAFENKAIFSISDLNAGTYIVRVKTHRDNTEKVTYLKLVKK